MAKSIKFKNDTYLDSTGIVHNQKILADILYPVGSIYLSINSTSPASIFGGTWEQIKDDAYLKIVISNGGKLDGTSKNHKIPIESMPSHSHKLLASYGYNSFAETTAFGGSATSAGTIWGLQSTGGGQPYYPYYYGVYAWYRTK